MADKKIKIEKSAEQVYTIPLREKCRSAVRYKKTPKAVKSVKEFLVRHMKVYDRDLKKIKIDRALNEFLWGRGIKRPPHKVKVKVFREGEIIRVELFELTKKLSVKKAQEEKREIKGQAKKSKKPKAVEEKPKEDADADGVADKVEEKEKKSAIVDAGQDFAKAEAKKMKHSTTENNLTPKRPVRQALQK